MLKAGAALGLLGVLGLAGHSAASSLRDPHLNSKGAAAGEGLQNKGLAALAIAAGESAVTAAELIKSGKETYHSAHKAYKELAHPAKHVYEKVWEHMHHNRTKEAELFAHLKGKELFPKNGMKDGNPCPDDEEEFGQMCYAKCRALTKGKYPIRTTAFSCCREEPCSFFNSKMTAVWDLCKGFNVGQQRTGEAICPHATGDCLANEEFFLGKCYKKCSVLTDDEFPYRFGVAECCKYHDKLACLDPLNVKANLTFNVGGGAGDPEWEEKAGESHAPLAELAEVTTTTTLPTLAPTPVPPPLPEAPEAPPAPVLPEVPAAPATPEVPAPPALPEVQAPASIAPPPLPAALEPPASQAVVPPPASPAADGPAAAEDFEETADETPPPSPEADEGGDVP